MQLSENGWKFLEQNEGTVLHPYRDQGGVPTIGIGTTFYPNGVHVTMFDPPITLEEAQEYAQSVVTNIANALAAMIKVPLNQNQIDSLIDFMYNEGGAALHGSTALRLINANPTDPNIRGALAMWDKLHVDGKLVFSQDLADRRAREADLYFSS